MKKAKEIHFRPSFIYRSPISPGERRHTVVGVKEGNTLKIGQSTCSEGDCFRKKLGVTIAHGRAIKKPIETINIEGLDRKQIADKFYTAAKIFPMNHGEIVYPGLRG